MILQAGLYGEDGREISAIVVASIYYLQNTFQVKMLFASKFTRMQKNKNII